jgi:Flp pilus assembly protein TadG
MPMQRIRPTRAGEIITGWAMKRASSIAIPGLAGAIRLVTARLRSFRRNTRGNVAVMFTLAVLPVLGFIGSAVDYNLINSTKAKLDATADAAVLVAVNRPSLSISAAAAQAAALNMFNAQPLINGITLNNLAVNVTDSATGRSATANYTAQIPTQFMGLMGFNTMSVTGTSTAASALPTYVDFYLLLDNTPSMGVAATPADVATMVANTPDKCAFACHDLSNANNYYNLAKSLGVTMRIDVVRQATQQLMTTATATAIVPNQFRMAIYTFGSSCSGAGLTTITALTSNLSSAQTAASNIDLMTTPSQNYNNDQCTDYDNVMAAMNGAITTPGPGSSSSPQKFLFFISDGVADAYYPTTCSQPTTGGRCQEPLTNAACTTMKNRGVQIAVLYTTYLPLPTNAWYNTWIAPFNAGPYGPSPNSKIALNMQSCASPGFYFEVSPTQGISSAMTALFQKAVAQAHLTN